VLAARRDAAGEGLRILPCWRCAPGIKHAAGLEPVSKLLGEGAKPRRISDTFVQTIRRAALTLPSPRRRGFSDPKTSPHSAVSGSTELAEVREGRGFLANVATGLAALFQVLLVIFFGPIELTSRHDLGGDGAREFAALGEALARGGGGGLLLGRVIENGRAILRAHVGALAVALRGIVVLPEGVQQLLVRNVLRIEFNFDRFGMARAAGADLFIARVGRLAAGIADRGGVHAFDLPKGRLDSPKATGGERGFFHGY
jgi:hypothetical protein